MKIAWKLPAFALTAAAVVGWLAVDQENRTRALSVWRQISGAGMHGEPLPRKDWLASPDRTASPLPPGVVELTESQAAAIGLKTTTVKIQTEQGVLIAGDAFMRLGNIERRHPIGINESMEEALTAYDRIAREADIIVPLYDPAVWERHPGGRIA